eukprot:CAMPEP_0173423600 /NCGR_PEP_ID=MMETSP1357-20121228/3851_1 /TAXON_ID=77926 /ORGANISM="Hemiselmis rufescens, Strain PCC563" /LENGTH=315 /DNA_ID=CAMNT_0014386747 /DNA_START=14 /DNA_END=958 /DNA_ORIENTATION=+
MGTLFQRNPGLSKTETEIGFVDITLHDARGIPKMDSSGLADPYVIVSVLNKDGSLYRTKKSKVIKQTLLPKWEELFSFPIRDAAQSISFTMYDHDDFGKDDFMAVMKLKMEECMREDRSDMFKMINQDGDDVIGEDGSPCMTRLTIKYTPHADKLSLALTKSIYDQNANEEDLKLAIRAAAGTHPKKRVLLQLGSDWCLACKKLFYILVENRNCRQLLDNYYELVLLDAEMEQNFPVLKKLGDPQHLGFPVLVVLDAYGRYITTQNTSELEKDPAWVPEGGIDPRKVFKFLTYWREDGPNNEDHGFLGLPDEAYG